MDQLDRRAAHAARQLEVVGPLGHLDRRGVGQHRIDADHHRRPIGRVAERPRLGDVLAEPVQWQRIERHRRLVDDLEAVVADVGDPGLGIAADHDARRYVGPAVVRAVLGHRQGAEVYGVAGDDVLVDGRVLHHHRGDPLGQSRQDAIEDGGLGGLQRNQRLGARVVDARHQGEARAVVLEDTGRPAHRSALAQCLGNLQLQGHRPVDIDQFTMLTQRTEKFTKILKRHAKGSRGDMTRLPRPT